MFSSDTKNCKTCDRVQSILETRQSDLGDAGVRVVKLADRKTAKQNGVLTFPGLTFFKAGKGHNFEGKRKGARANKHTHCHNVPFHPSRQET